jgi:glycosyltransferase involved in cell wall biosynthesis
MARVLLNLLGGGSENLSGIGMYAVSIYASLLNRRRHDYVLLTSWKPHLLQRHLPLDGVTIIRGGATPSEKLQFWFETAQVANAAARQKIDTVFTPWPLGPVAGGRKRILVLHDLYRRTHPELHNWHYQLAWNTYFPLAVATASEVVCVSQATANEFRRYYPGAASKAVTVSEASTIQATPLPEPPIPGRYGLCVSSNMPTKNLPRLIEAAELLRRRGIDVPIVWIGWDKDDEVRRSLARFPELMSFILPGRFSEQELATWYAHADFYVAPSLTEGFCLPVVEAQKFGVPVVCSDIEVLREVAGRGARFFDPVDPEAIANGIAAVVTDRTEHARLSALAAANAARFSWDDAAAKLEALF